MVTKGDIESLVSDGESEVQEFKERTSGGLRRAGAETACAMLNTRGGRVIFGVTADGRIVGQDVSDKTVEDVVAELSRIEPPAFPRVDRVPVGDGNECIVVTVERGQRRPYAFKGDAYRRTGNSTIKLTRDEYNSMLFEALHGTQRWENEPAQGWSIDRLDRSEITRTVDEAIRRGRLSDPGTRDTEELLRGLGLLTSDGLLRAAVVLFGREDALLPEFPQCRLRLARFKGIDKTEFVDNRQYHGHAFELLIRADQFLRDHLPIAGRVVADVFERSDDPIYPPAALREALANALCHRDYAIGGGSVAIGIYDDRLEISSSGELHFGLTTDALYGPHESLPWNPVIASVFFRRGIIESWGRGTLKMAELSERAGLPRPDFEQAGGALLVRFRPSRYLPPQRIGRDLTEQQRQLLAVLAEHGSIALGQILDVMDATANRRSVQSDLQFLRSLDLVIGEGWGRGARWSLHDDPPRS